MQSLQIQVPICTCRVCKYDIPQHPIIGGKISIVFPSLLSDAVASLPSPSFVYPIRCHANQLPPSRADRRLSGDGDGGGGGGGGGALVLYRVTSHDSKPIVLGCNMNWFLYGSLRCYTHVILDFLISFRLAPPMLVLVSFSGSLDGLTFSIMKVQTIWN